MTSRIALSGASVLTVLLLQATLIGPMSFPVPVSLPVLLVIVVGIFAGPGVGLTFGFVTGLLADLGSDHPAGVLALCWMGAGLVGGIIGGLATQRGYGTRGIALMAAGIAGAAGLASTVLLSLLGSHAASLWLAVRDVIPIALTDALLGLLVVPAVRAMLRLQGVRSPRPDASVIGRAYVSG